MALVNRWYDILENLLFQNQMTVDSLRKILQISPQTLVKSIEQLNNLLDGDIEISLKNNILELHVYDYARLETILAGSLRKSSDFNSASRRIAYILKRLLESTRPIFIDDLAEEIGVSRSTLNKDLKSAKSLAKQYDISIQGIPNRGIEMVGQEIQKRLLFIHQVYNYFDNSVLQEDTYSFLEQLYQSYRLPHKIQELLTKSIAISIKRVHDGYQIVQSIPFYSNEVNSDAFMEELVYHLELDYHISLSQFERDFISFPLSTQYILSLTYQEKPLSQEFLQLYQKMVNQVEETLLIHFDQEKLFVEIHNHLKFLLNRLIFRIQTNDLFHGEIKYKYPLAFEMALVAAKVLEQKFSVPLELSECSYLALYFELIMREKDQVEQIGSKKIAVVCTTGRGTANMICQRLTKVLGPDIEISQFSEEQFNPEKDDDYFAIFTTIPLKFGQLKSPLVQITNLFNDQWLQNEWQRVHYLHQRLTNKNDVRFLRLGLERNYQAYLLKMAEQLIKEGLVDKEFTQRIIDRELKQSTILGGQIAFPHAINKNEKPMVVMIGVLDHIYEAVNNQVSLIFMAAIPQAIEEEMETGLLEVYDDIFKIASNEQLKNELTSIETAEAFQLFIEERGLF